MRNFIAIALTLTLTTTGLGRDLPFDTNALIPAALSLIIFAAYLYLCRTLTRLPVAIVITIRRIRYAQQHYGLSRRESLRDGFVRGFLDTRRWTVGPLALIDRLAVIGFTIFATTPFLGAFLVRLGGLFGIALLLIIYLMRGKFALLVDDKLDSSASYNPSLPFLKLDS